MTNSDSDLILTNCIFSGNSGGHGAAVYDQSYRNTRITNCTFTDNRADNSCGGLHVIGSPTIANCIFWGNRDSGGIDESAQIQISSGTAVVRFCDIHGLDTFSDGNNINVDPRFVDSDGPDEIAGTDDDNLRLSPGSPCIDAGDSNSLPEDITDVDGDDDTDERIPFDINGNLRFFDDPDTPDTGKGDPPDYPEVVDMGAYEVSEASGYEGVCGDVRHPYPIGDLNLDCKVDLTDMALLTRHWLECTKPVCD
jgi:hypothetical protein